VAAELSRVRAVSQKDLAWLWFVLLPLGVVLRVLLSYVLHVRDWHSSLAVRAELTNALESFIAVSESVANVQVAGVSPYAGLSCSHAPPLLLAVFTSLLEAPSNAATALRGEALFFSPPHLVQLAAWCVLDCLIALLLFELCRDFYARFPSQTAALPWQHALARSNRVIRHLGLWVAGAYLLNPVTLASCVIFNLSHVTHMVLAAMLLAGAHGRPVAAGALLAVAVYLDMYPFIALLPLLLLLHKGRHGAQPDAFPQYTLDKHIRHSECRFIDEAEAASDPATSVDEFSDAALALQQHQSGFTLKRVLKVAYQPIGLPEGAELDGEQTEEQKQQAQKVALPSDAALGVREYPWRWDVPLLATAVLSFVCTLALLAYLSFELSGGSWSWLSSSYGYNVYLPSLSPTYSLFWYFFTALFDRFVAFFLVIFHMHTLVYVIPLCVRLRDEPLFLCALLHHLTCVFRAYPTLPGLVFGALCLAGLNLPLLLLGVRRIYLLVYLNLVSVLTQALMRFLWLHSGGGNANFNYFQHVLFVFTHLIAVMEAVGAVRRRHAATMEGQVQETIARRRAARAELSGKDAQNAVQESKKDA